MGKFDKKCDDGFLLGYSTISKAYRVWNLGSGQLEEVHDVEFDETQGSQSEAQNLEDVRGAQLENAMKNMDIGDIRPRQVDDEDTPLFNTSVQIDTNQVSTSMILKCKIIQVIKCKYSNLQMLQGITQLIILFVTFKVEFKQDLDWLLFVSITLLSHSKNQPRLKMQ